MAEMDGLHTVIVPAWWPSPEQPFNGIFCEDYARAFADAGAKVGVLFPDLISVRYLHQGTSIPILPRLSRETLAGTADVPILRIRGLHTALRQPSIQMHRYRRWLRQALAIYTEEHGPPDILHAMCAIPAGWACTHLQQDLAARVVITEHTGPFSLVMTHRAGESFVRSAMAKAAAVVAVSEAQREEIHAAGIRRDIGVIANPVSAEFAATEMPAARVDSSERKVFHGLFVGRLTEAKGVSELIEAATFLAADVRFNIHWHFVGTGPLEQKIRQRFASAGLADRLFLHGVCRKREIARLLRESHFLVLPSHAESFGLVLCEALSVGRPVVGTLGTGCETIVREGDGELARAGDARDLADALRRVVSEYDRWDWAGISARARERFSQSTIAWQYAELYREVLSSRR